MKYEKEIRDIISRVKIGTEPIESITSETKLQDIGMDSLRFVEIIIEIENEFKLEFPDDKLVMSECGTIIELCNTIDLIINCENNFNE